jgi:hypothetical protein
VLREYLSAKAGHPFIRISSECKELIECLPALLCDVKRNEDASDSPHKITHAPEALRYAVMSRPQMRRDDSTLLEGSVFRDFNLNINKHRSFFD